MTHTRYAFIKANWHADIVSRSLDGLLQALVVDGGIYHHDFVAQAVAN